MALGGTIPLMMKAAAAAPSGDVVTKSLRISAASQHYLRNTGFATGSANGTFTLSCWIKRTDLSRSSHPEHNFQIFYWYDGFLGECSLAIQNGNANAAKFRFTKLGVTFYYSNGVLRDTAAWAHILISVSSGAVTVKYNGETVISGVTGVPTWGTSFNISMWAGDDNSSFGGYIADVYGVDGMALDYTDFTTTDATTGQLKPIAYSGDVGTDGFHLDFKDADAIGNDVSGNDNDFSTANLVPADVMDDNPSAGMNYCVYNAVFAGATGLSEGNLKCTTTARGTFDAMSFASYWEIEANTMSVVGGVISETGTANTVSVTNGSTFGFRLSAAGALDYTSNGSSWTSIATGLSGEQFPYVTGGTTTANFGQSTLSYSVPSGYAVLSTGNLPTPTIKKGVTYFDTKIYDDGAGAKIFDNGTVSMQPDLVWVKSRGSSNDHKLTDSVREEQNSLESNTTDTEVAESSNVGVMSFDADGFTIGSSSSTTGPYADQTGDGMVAWAWKKSATAGFNIVGWTGDDDGFSGGTQAVAHGLGVAPEMVIAKNRTDEAGGNGNWIVYHKDISSGDLLKLNSADGEFTPNDTLIGSIGSTNVSFGNDSIDYEYLNSDNSYGSGTPDTYIGYFFASVAGFSKVGGYASTGTNPLFIWTGFAPAFLMIKNRYSAYSWRMFDAARSTVNERDKTLIADIGQAEDDDNYPIDFLSNGFALRSSEESATNTDGESYIYVAFAEFPLKYANAK